MYVRYACPSCQQRSQKVLDAAVEVLNCPGCNWERPVRQADIQDGLPQKCLVCGCQDLWRQKHFPPALGLTMVALGALLSTIAWAYYMPKLAIGVLLFFALIDVLLYTFMKDVLVCYRCQSHYGNAALLDDHPQFNLETAERYRQEAARLAAARPPASSGG